MTDQQKRKFTDPPPSIRFTPDYSKVADRMRQSGMAMPNTSGTAIPGTQAQPLSADQVACSICKRPTAAPFEEGKPALCEVCQSYEKGYQDGSGASSGVHLELRNLKEQMIKLKKFLENQFDYNATETHMIPVAGQGMKLSEKTPIDKAIELLTEVKQTGKVQMLQIRD